MVSCSVISVPREGGGRPSRPLGLTGPCMAVVSDCRLFLRTLPPASVLPSSVVPCCSGTGGRGPPLCACSRCELIGRKKACDVREGTCVLLTALCGRPVLAPDTLLVTFVRCEGVLETKPLREAEAWGQAPRCEEIPVTPVLGLDVPSAVAVRVLGRRLCDEMVASAAYPSPSSETISVIREDNTLATSPASDSATWELGVASTAEGLAMADSASRDVVRKPGAVVLYIWIILYYCGISPMS